MVCGFFPFFFNEYCNNKVFEKKSHFADCSFRFKKSWLSLFYWILMSANLLITVQCLSFCRQCQSSPIMNGRGVSAWLGLRQSPPSFSAPARPRQHSSLHGQEQLYFLYSLTQLPLTFVPFF